MKFLRFFIFTSSIFEVSGKLPIRLDTSFRVYFINTSTYGDHVAGLLYRNEPRVAVDLEGYNLGTYGIITLVQVAVSTDRVYIFDTLKCPYFLEKGLLRKILESDKITKVFHSLAGDAGNLCRQFNVTLRNVFDTQVAFFTLQQKYPDLRLSYNATDGWSGWQISLNELMALYDIDGNQVKGEVKYLYRKNPNLWSYRPLCPVLLHYAGEDVNMLLRLQDAMNNHPIFKLNTKAILSWTQRNIQKQSQMALTIAQIAGPWKMPYTPQPRSVIRHERKPWLSQLEWDKQREGVYNESISRRQYMARCNDLIQNGKNKASCKLTNSTTTARQPTISHYNRSKREMIDVSSALAETYLSNSDSINSYIRNPSDPYIHNPSDPYIPNPSDPYIHNPSDSYIQNPGSSRENACLLVITVGLFLILIFIFWKESSSFFRRNFKRTW